MGGGENNKRKAKKTRKRLFLHRCVTFTQSVPVLKDGLKYGSRLEISNHHPLVSFIFPATLSFISQFLIPPGNLSSPVGII